MLLADEPQSARAFRMLLADWGYSVQFKDTVEAIDQMEPDFSWPNVLIADLVNETQQMALSEALRNSPSASTCGPVLVCTASDLHPRWVGLDMQVTVLAKPASPQSIHRWLKQFAEPTPCPASLTVASSNCGSWSTL